MLFVPLSLSEFIGRFHPVLVHLPIGILLVGLLLLWLSGKEQFAVSHQVIKVVLLCGVFTALASCITGYLLSLNGDYDDTLVALHMWMAIGLTLIAMLLFAKVASRQYDITYKIAAIVLLISILVTGHLGGSLTHGADYLTSALSSTSDSVTADHKTITNIQEANVYADVVQPILQSRCYNCHGTTRRKGGLRMDDSTLFQKGGKDGVAFIAHKGDESELIKRLLLPDEDEHHMPPKQKPQLNERQILLLHWWIDQGAPFAKKVKDLDQPEKVKPLLTALQNSNQKKAPSVLASIPAAPVESGSTEAIQALKKIGVIVMPVAQNSNYLMANFVMANTVSDKDLQLLLPLKKQLVWLKIGNTPITDGALAFIGQCVALTQLQLNGTAITDRGLSQLKNLQHLQSLNLVGTKVTAAGVQVLGTLPQLQSLYLYQTAIEEKDRSLLRKNLPKPILDFGGYIIPSLVTDTTEVKQPLTK